MTPFKSWQDALIAFIRVRGHDYQDAYNLTAEFEEYLIRNRVGTYFLLKEKRK